MQSPAPLVGSTDPILCERVGLTLYERLIDHGIAIADNRRDGIVDHVTARRLAIWFAARPQEPDFARSLDGRHNR